MPDIIFAFSFRDNITKTHAEEFYNFAIRNKVAILSFDNKKNIERSLEVIFANKIKENPEFINRIPIITGNYNPLEPSKNALLQKALEHFNQQTPKPNPSFTYSQLVFLDTNLDTLKYAEKMVDSSGNSIKITMLVNNSQGSPVSLKERLDWCTKSFPTTPASVATTNTNSGSTFETSSIFTQEILEKISKETQWSLSTVLFEQALRANIFQANPAQELLSTQPHYPPVFTFTPSSNTNVPNTNNQQQGNNTQDPNDEYWHQTSHRFI